MGIADKNLVAMNDPAIVALAMAAFYAAKECYSATPSVPSQSEDELKNSLLFLFLRFGQSRHAEIAHLRAEVLRLRMLVIEPMPTGWIRQTD